MYTITFRIALSVLLVLNSATLITAAARRFNVTDILTKRKTPDNLTCGTTGNAVASDCESLLASDWVNLNYGRTCSYQPGGDIVPLTGYNPICSPGNCCVYVTENNLSIEDIKVAANYIMGCKDADTNQVNGRTGFVGDENTFVCLSDGAGCNDCFT